MPILIPDKIKPNNSSEFSVTDAQFISGHKSVKDLNDLYTIPDAILSPSKENLNDDAIGQEWYVLSEETKYRLKDWNNRKSITGWEPAINSGIGKKCIPDYEGSPRLEIPKEKEYLFQGEAFNSYENVDVLIEGHSETFEANRALGLSSHAEGLSTTAIGDVSHTEGDNTLSFGSASHSEGSRTGTIGSYSHSEGIGSITGNIIEYDSFHNPDNYIYLKIIDNKTVETSDDSFNNSIIEFTHIYSTYRIQLDQCKSINHRYVYDYTFVYKEDDFENFDNFVPGSYRRYSPSIAAHAEGGYTKAIGLYSHAEGGESEAHGDFSHSQGYFTSADNFAQTSLGTGNVREEDPSPNYFNPSKILFSIGNGNGNDSHGNVNYSDALRMLGDGTMWIAGVGGFTGTNATADNSLLKVLYNESFPVGVKNMDLSYSSEGLTYGSDVFNLPINSSNTLTYSKSFKDFRTFFKPPKTSVFSLKEILGRILDPNSYPDLYNNTALGLCGHAEGYISHCISLNGTHVEGFAQFASGYGSHAEGSLLELGPGGGIPSRKLEILVKSIYNYDENKTTRCKFTEIYNDDLDFLFMDYADNFVCVIGEDGILRSANIWDHGTPYLDLTPGLNPLPEIPRDGLKMVFQVIFIGAHGQGAHSEGLSSIAIGLGTHAEGASSSSIGGASHAEGFDTHTFGLASHAEGHSCSAKGDCSFAGGDYTTTIGKSSFAHGTEIITLFDNLTSFGYYPSLRYSGEDVTKIPENLQILFSISNGNELYGKDAFVMNKQGDLWIYGVNGFVGNNRNESNTLQKGIISKSDSGFKYEFVKDESLEEIPVESLKLVSGEVFNLTSDLIFENSLLKSNNASGYFSHAEGFSTQSLKIASHSEGYKTISSGKYSHSEGYKTTASGDASHAEGLNTIANNLSHSEGVLTKSNFLSHSEGFNTESSSRSHAEGDNTKASLNSHSEGYYTNASGESSHTEGVGTTTTNKGEHAQGIYNKSNVDTIHSIGIGIDNLSRKNAQEILKNGQFYIKDIGGYQGDNLDNSKSLQEVILELSNEIKTLKEKLP